MTQFERLGLKGVIFDMDGLLFDTEALYLEAWPHTGEAMGFPITAEIAKATIGYPMRAYAGMFQELFGPGFSMAEAHRVMAGWVRSRLEERGMPLKPGVRELISFLHQKKIPVALGTSNSSQVARAYLEAAGLLSCFGPIVAGDMVEQVKPAPDIFLKAASDMGLLPEQCLVLEDSPMGIESAHRAACLPVMVPDLLGPTAETVNQAWRIFGSLTEAADALFYKNSI